MSRMLKLVAGCVLAVSGMTVVGCSSEPDVETPPQTEGERLRLEAARTEKKAEMMLRAEKLVTEGNAKKAERQTLRNQGKSVEGEKIEAQGEALIREGEALRKQAEQMDTSVERSTSSSSASPTTRPVRP